MMNVPVHHVQVQPTETKSDRKIIRTLDSVSPREKYTSEQKESVLTRNRNPSKL